MNIDIDTIPELNAGSGNNNNDTQEKINFNFFIFSLWDVPPLLLFQGLVISRNSSSLQIAGLYATPLDYVVFGRPLLLTGCFSTADAFLSFFFSIAAGSGRLESLVLLNWYW